MAELPLVLVVEDEYLLQGDVERALADEGFATESVFSGEEAVAKFMDEAKNFKALVTDVNLGMARAAGKSQDGSEKKSRRSPSST